MIKRETRKSNEWNWRDRVWNSDRRRASTTLMVSVPYCHGPRWQGRSASCLWDNWCIGDRSCRTARAPVRIRPHTCTNALRTMLHTRLHTQQ